MKYSTDLDACSLARMPDGTLDVGIFNCDNFSIRGSHLEDLDLAWPTRVIYIVNRIQQQQFLHVRILMQQWWIERRFLVTIVGRQCLSRAELDQGSLLNGNNKVLLLQLSQ